jgi:hypothetical protein
VNQRAHRVSQQLNLDRTRLGFFRSAANPCPAASRLTSCAASVRVLGNDLGTTLVDGSTFRQWW